MTRPERTDLIIITDAGFGPDHWHGRRYVPLADWGGIPADVLALAGDDDPDDARWVLATVEAIRIRFPSPQDGRGFSLARRLRDDGFKGRLRAEGPLMTDQYRHVRQSGFDEVAISHELAQRMPESHWLDVINLPLPDYQNRLIQYGQEAMPKA